MNNNKIGTLLDEKIKAPDNITRKKGLHNYENPNNIITQKGWDYIINTVENDTHFSSVLATRANDLVSHGFKIMPAYTRVKGVPVVTKRDREIADFVAFVLDNLAGSFEKDIVAMMTHISRGFSISEKNYQKLSSGKYQGKVGIKDIRFKQQDIFAFSFDDYGRYELRTTEPDQKTIPKNKVIHLISGFDDENPYGDSVAAKCAFWVWMKLNGIKYWAIHQERFGSPLPVLGVPDNIRQDKDKQKIADEILRAAIEDTGIQLPKGMKLEYLEAIRNGDAGYNSFYEITNREMSKAVLGSTLTNDVGKSGMGNHALGKVHSDTTSIYFNFDMISVQSILNYQLIKQLVDINYPNVEKYPKLIWDCFDAGAFVSAAQGIAALANIGNAKIPATWINEVLNIPFPDGEEEVLKTLQDIAQIEKPKGIDNRAKHKKYNFSKEKKHIDENENIIHELAKKISSKWLDFAKKISKRDHIYDTDFYEFQYFNLAPFYEKLLIVSHLKGVDDVKKDFSDYSAYKPFEKLIKDYLKRKVVTTEEYNELEAIAKRKAFTIARTDSETIIKKIKDKLLEVLKAKETLPDFNKQVIEIFDKVGLTAISGHHIETVLRNNLNTQYNEARFETFEKLPDDEFPALQIVAIIDSNVRDAHARLDGYTRPKDDDIWLWLRPPFDHNCRCTIRAIHNSEYYEISDWVPNRSEYPFL